MGPAYSLHCSADGEQPSPLMLGLRSKSYFGRPGGLIASCSPLSLLAVYSGQCSNQGLLGEMALVREALRGSIPQSPLLLH
jgi:hypothetical protein